jgi:putative copper export protein
VIIFVTAVYNAWVYIGSVEAAVKSFYGWTVIVKTVLFLFLLLLGAFNRYVSVPGMLETAGSPAEKQGAISHLIKQVLVSVVPNRKDRLSVQRFAHRVRIEAFIVVAILICASLLRHEIPAKHYLHQHDVHHEHHHTDGGVP